MAVYNVRTLRQRQRRTSRRRWLFAGSLFVLLILILAWRRLPQDHAHSDGSSSRAGGPPSALDLVHRRSLHELAPEAAGVQLDRWRLFVLTPEPASADWQPGVLEPALKDVATPLAISWHTGSSAGGLATYLGVEGLPGAVLLPPFCQIGTCQGPDLPAIFRPREAAVAPADALAAWIRASFPAWVLLANDSGRKVTFRQRLAGAGDGDEADIRTLDTGGREWIASPLQATWTARYAHREEGAAGGVLAQRNISGDTLITVRGPGDCNFFTRPGCTMPNPDKHFSQKMLQAREDSEAGRVEDIRNQSATIVHYTKPGFEKRRAPRALFAALHAYFEAHAADYAREDWDDDDIFVNHDQSQFLLVDIPESGPMRPAIYEAVQGIFEEWAGGQRLKPTAIYGVRVYTRGNVLRDHVDVEETHHISAIINVDQDVEEPWPLEIIDHEGVAHQALLSPGDMLLYEGASCAHGRRTPLKGNWMANVFVHFKPATQRFDN